MKKRRSLRVSNTTLIMIAMLSGALFGLLFPEGGQSISFLGDIFLSLIQMSLGLLILGQVSAAVAKINLRQLGKLGSRTIGLFVLSVIFATIWGVLWTVVFQPGASVTLAQGAADAVVGVEDQSLIDIIVGFFPSNIFESLAEGSMMQITVFALVFGAALSLLRSNKEMSFMNGLEEFNDIILEMMGLVMKFAPVGVFALLANAMGTHGLTVILPLIYYVLVFYGAVVSYMFLWAFIAGAYVKESPWQISKQLLNMSLFTFAANSSAASLPVQMADSRNKVGLSEEATSFIMPLGMSLNSPASAMHNSMALVIAAQMHGLNFGLEDYVVAVLIGIFTSYATAVIPGGGLVSLNMVLPQMGFGAETIAIFATVDYPTGMMRSMGNVHLDVTTGMMAADSVGELDHDVLNERSLLAERE